MHLFYIQVKTIVRRPFRHTLEKIVSFSNSHLHYFELVRIGLWVLLLTGNGNYWSSSMLHWLQGRLIPLISYFHWILWSVKAAWSPSLFKLVQDRNWSGFWKIYFRMWLCRNSATVKVRIQTMATVLLYHSRSVSAQSPVLMTDGDRARDVLSVSVIWSHYPLLINKHALNDKALVLDFCHISSKRHL